MGEYILYKNQLTKIGTCEDLFYTRYSDLKEAIEQGYTGFVQGNSKPEEYLKPENGFRFRFPFPDEDGSRFFDYYKFGYERSLEVELVESLAPGLFEVVQTSEEWTHYSINHSPWKDNRIHLSFPCPISTSDWKLVNGVNLTINRLAIGLQQLKQVEGSFWVVIGCLYCGSKMRLERGLADELTKCIEAGRLQDWKEINKRILEGYVGGGDVHRNE